MVLESLIGPQDAESHPWKIVLLGFAFATLAVWLAGASGFSQTGVIIVGFTSLAATPFLVKLFDFDTQSAYGAAPSTSSSLFSRNFITIIVLASLFVGMLAGYVFWMLYLPTTQSNTLFDAQINELGAINPQVMGRAIQPAFGADPIAAFQIIFFHNLQVTGLVLFLSLLYGIGSIVILSWNASVIAAFLTAVARKFSGAGTDPSTLLEGLGTGIAGILPHGTLELMAYLVMALAGSLISRAVVQGGNTNQDSWSLLIFDAARLVALSIAFLALAAVIESNVLSLS